MDGSVLAVDTLLQSLMTTQFCLYMAVVSVDFLFLCLISVCLNKATSDRHYYFQRVRRTSVV